jgi:Anti-sigma-K factor rskA/Putative zinc-finger
MTCQDPIQELLEAYVLGTLDPPGRTQVELHLQTCADCQRLVSEYAEVASKLPQALATASQLSLPPEIKSRVFDILAAERASTPTRQILFRWRPRLVILSLAILLAVSLAWGFQLNVALAQERALRSEFANLLDQREIVLEVIDSSKTTKAFLRATASDSNSYGKLFTRSDMPDAVAMAARLPVPQAGMAYHLWVTKDRQTYLVGVMKVNDKGFGLLVFMADQPGPVYEAVQLILQPIGSMSPSGIPIIAWETSP